MGTYLSTPSMLCSSMRVVLTASPDVAMYKSSSVSSEGLIMIAKFSMYALRASKAVSSSPYWKFPEPFNALKNGRHFSADLDMNLFSEASQPVCFCTPLFVVGGFIHLMASIFFGFASIPLSVIMQPSNLPLWTPKTHFSGFNFRSCRRRFANVCQRSWM